MLIQQDPLFLAIDLGTSGPKIAIIDRRGTVISHCVKKTKLISIPPNGFEQDSKDWWDQIKRGIHHCLQDPQIDKKKIKAISCTAQWSGCIPIDNKGAPLRNSLIWMDSRGAKEIEKLNQSLLKIGGYPPWKLLHWIYKTGGAPSHSGKDTLGHILYIKENEPSIYKKTYKFLEPKDFVNYKLTGLIATSYDTSTLCWVTNNRNISNIHYDEKLLQQSGIDKKKLPSMQPSTSILGPLSKDLAQEFQLSESTQVVVGSPDIQSAAIGSGTVENYQANLYIGTSSWITCHVPYKKTSIQDNVASLPSALPGKYLVCTEQETAGECLRYLKKILFSSEEKDLEIFKKLEKLAQESQPGCENMIFTPWLNGERTPVDNHRIRAGFHNVSIHHNKSHFVRSVYEGVAYNSKWLLQTVEKFISRPIHTLNFIGGGADSELWCQIHANILGCTINQVEEPRQANTRGAAWIAAIALGYIKENEIPQYLKIKKIFTKKKETTKQYEQSFQQFKKLYHSQHKIFSLLNTPIL